MGRTERFIGDIMSYRTYKEGLTQIVEIDPLDLKHIITDKPASLVKEKNFVTDGYYTTQTHKTPLPNYWTSDPVIQSKPYLLHPVSIMMSDGHLIMNRQPHDLPAGTLIVYKNGKVEVSPILDLAKERKLSEIKFAAGGCSILPKIRMKEEGFCKRMCSDGKVIDFSDIGRECLRPVMGYNPVKNKVYIAVRDKSNILRGQQTLINLGCIAGITLDAGGSTCLVVDGKAYFMTSRHLFSHIGW